MNFHIQREIPFKQNPFRFQEKNPNLNRDSNLGSPGSGSDLLLKSKL